MGVGFRGWSNSVVVSGGSCSTASICGGGVEFIGGVTEEWSLWRPRTKLYGYIEMHATGVSVRVERGGVLVRSTDPERAQWKRTGGPDKRTSPSIS